MRFLGFGSTGPLADGETRKKFFEAERYAGWVRAALTVVGALYLLLNPDDPRLIPELGWPVLALIAAYAAYVLVGKPYRRYPGFGGVYATTLLDAVLSTIWIAATGGWDSSWYPLYLAMTAATAFRFSYRETIAAAAAYGVLYSMMLLATGTWPAGEVDELALRILFILVIAVLSGPLARGSIEQIRARVAIEDAAREARQLERLKDQFFANVSHELRTPLSLIVGPIRRLLTTGELTPEERDELRVAERNAGLLLQQVNNLLDLSRLDSRAMEPAYARVDLAEVVRVDASYFEGLATEQDVFVELDLPSSLPGEVDPDKLQRVLLNLLSNAFKFTPNGGVIRCTLKADAQDAVLAVEDSGPGIPEDLREAVFERFRQVDGGANRLVGGTGLGLAITREFVELHGGSVGVGAAGIGGARFEVRLPLRAPDGATVAGPAGPAHAQDVTPVLDELRAYRTDGRPQPSPEQGERPLVLVVEDNPDLSAFIETLLRPRYRVATARDGRLGLERARYLQPDLILADIMLPYMSGDEMIRELREDRDLREVPVVVLTARADDRQRVELLQDGVHDHLTKPFQPDELLARVDGLVRRRRETIRQLSELNAGLEQRVAERTRQIEHQAEQLRRMAADLSAAEHRERRRLAQALHDNLQQLLVTAKLNLHQAAMSASAEGVAHLERAEEALVRAIQASRDVTIDLYPPLLYERGLAAALEWFGRRARQSHGLDVLVRVDPAANPQDENLQVFLFASVKELLLNVVKHAQCDHARVTMRKSDSKVVVTVEDDGVGCDPDAVLDADRSEGFGLLHLRERLRLIGGSMSIEAKPGDGCRIRLVCPLEAHAPKVEV